MDKKKLRGKGLRELDTELGLVKGRVDWRRKYGSSAVASLQPAPFSGGSLKSARGRPEGSCDIATVDTAEGSITLHVIIVERGEDVVSKIFSFFEEAPRAVFILSATGEVASVRIGITSVAFTQYEALFEILTLDGSFMFGESGSNSKKTMFTISLAMPNGNVFGGRVVSPLLAAGPIQIIVASLKQDIGNQPSTAANVRVPVQRAPKATIKGGSVIEAHENMNRASLHTIGQNVPQASQAMTDVRSPTKYNTNFPHI